MQLTLLRTRNPIGKVQTGLVSTSETGPLSRDDGGGGVVAGFRAAASKKPLKDNVFQGLLWMRGLASTDGMTIYPRMYKIKFLIK